MSIAAEQLSATLARQIDQVGTAYRKKRSINPAIADRIVRGANLDAARQLTDERRLSIWASAYRALVRLEPSHVAQAGKV